MVPHGYGALAPVTAIAATMAYADTGDPMISEGG